MPALFHIEPKNTTIGDFLLGTTEFTVLVEIKKPGTKLFDTTQNRSRSWKLSNDLIDAVSQILAQKVAWEIKSAHDCYTDSGYLIGQKQATLNAY